MNEPQRLFDCIEQNLQNTPLDDMLAGKEGGQYKKYSTNRISEIMNDLGAGLLALGLGAGDMTTEGRDKIAILSKNRPEWIMVDLAVQQIPELIFVSGVELVGPLPSDLQATTVYAAGIPTSAKEPNVARALITFLRSPEAVTIIKAKGLDPG